MIATRKADVDKTLYREMKFTRESLDEGKRTIELAFSSEFPVPRWWGNEVLDHGAKSVRLGLLRDGAPLLLDHDRTKQIGVVESVKIGSDRIGRAVVRFGKSALAEEIFNDVLDEIRSKVSVGYNVYDLLLESREADVETYRLTDWEPFEISLVSIPADPSVGVGRSLEPLIKQARNKNMTPEEIAAAEAAAKDARRAATPAPQAQPPPAAAQTVDVRAIEDRARVAEQERTRGLLELGAKFPQYKADELAREFISSGKSVDDLSKAILERVGTGKFTPTADIGLTEKETKGYSIVRALDFLANPSDRGVIEAASFEIECSRAAAEKAGKDSKGLMVPHEVLRTLMPQSARRDLVAGTFSAGGATISQELLTGSFIELLRNRLILAQLGVTTLNGLVGNISIPRQTAGAPVYWVGENQAATEGQATFDQVTMSPKTVAGYTDVSRRLLKQSSMDVENLMRNDLAAAVALGIDLAGLYGLGTTNQPLGLKNTTGVQTKDFGADTPTFAEIVDLETKVATSNADFGNLAYATNATMRGAMKSTQKVSGQAIMLWEDDELNGYGAKVSNQIAIGDLWFGNWADLIIGLWGGLDLMVDPFSQSTTGAVRVTAFQDVDVACRRPVSFVRGNNNL